MIQCGAETTVTTTTQSMNAIHVLLLQGKKNAVDTLKVGIKEETFMSWFPSREKECCRHFKGKNKGGDIHVAKGKKNIVDTLKVGI